MRRRVWRSPMGLPRSHACPEVGLRRPSRSLTEVVLPAPFGPRNPKTSPRGTVIDRPASAVVCPKRFERFTVWMAGEPAAAPGGAAATCSVTSVTSAGYNACSGQLVSDVDGVIALDGADDSVHDSVLDPDHAGADAGVVAQRQALDGSLDRHRCRGAELDRDRNRQSRAG